MTLRRTEVLCQAPPNKRTDRYLARPFSVYPEAEAAPGGKRQIDQFDVHIRFDFEQLRSKPEIRHGFYWATDTHSDWVEWSGKLLGLARTAETLVAQELARR